MNFINEVYSGSLSLINFSESKIINTINPHSYCISKKDNQFEKALIESDILLPDGIGIVFAVKLLTKKSLKKISGYDIFTFLAKRLNDLHGSVFFLGASNDTLQKIKFKFSQQYPNVNLSYYSPPYKSEFSKNESLEMCQKVNSFKPDILFVGMSAPKQEKWVFNNKENINANTIVSVGAVFDFYAGTIQRSSPFWINLGLEWLPRLIREPRRLFYRNFVSTPKFILEILSFKIFGKGIL